MNLRLISICFAATAMSILSPWAIADDDSKDLPAIFSTKFNRDDDDKQWKFVDDGWKIDGKDAGVLSLHKKKTNYQPKFRSPGHIALLKNYSVSNFELNVRAKSTHDDYNHQDVCLFFGYQSPTEFYYVHLGKKTDDHANQIFIVNKAARTKISLKTTTGTPWDDQWHDLRLTRNVATGEIKVYFDDMKTPAMTANDKTFTSGQVGLGSFDDTADFNEFSLKGDVVPQPEISKTRSK